MCTSYITAQSTKRPNNCQVALNSEIVVLIFLQATDACHMHVIMPRVACQYLCTTLIIVYKRSASRHFFTVIII